MNEQDRPNLSLGQPPGDLKRQTRSQSRSWLWLVVLLQTAALVLLVAVWLRPPVSPPIAAPASSADVDHLREVALAMEERGLSAQAAQAWQDYLDALPDAPDKAEVMYQAGKLYFDAEQYDQSAAMLVQADIAAAGDKDLKDRIGRKLIDALRRSGRYGEVGRELSRQVELGGPASGDARVLAMLSGESLTDADLDRMIERRVDNMLAVEGVAADPAARETLLKQLSSPEARRQMLQQVLQTELFARRARELKLDQHDEFIRARNDMVESLLAGQFLADELKTIQPTELDLDSYFKSHRDDYRQPATIKALAIPLAKDENADKVLEKVKSADDFRKLAQQRQASESPRQLVQGRPDRELGPVEELFSLDEGQWTKKPVIHNDRQWLVLVDRKTSASVPKLADVVDRVRADYVTRKQQELQDRLMRDLMGRYDVRILPEAADRK